MVCWHRKTVLQVYRVWQVVENECEEVNGFWKMWSFNACCVTAMKNDSLFGPYRRLF